VKTKQGKTMKKMFTRISAILFVMIAVSCSQPAKDAEEKSNTAVEWHKDATIYEVNIRQYTEEGTFDAFREHLPRLKKLGVDILWLMPIHPIGEKKKKGELGSYYSVKDYKDVNPEFGSKEDFKKLVDAAHEQGFRLILDWVANHTAWDNQLIEDHPEWYTRDSAGMMVSPYDWSDVADLNYENQEVRDYMSGALKYWVEEFDVDGYRCDVAGMVPTDFWERAVADMYEVKPVFMLAEDEGELSLLDSAFHMHYGWEFHHVMNQVAQGEESVDAFYNYFEKVDTTIGHSRKMHFLTNHDENSWNGTIEERMGDASEAMAVISFTIPGMPLIYSGQETGLDKQLEFFQKDPIAWEESPLEDFYAQLTQLKAENPALYFGEYGGTFEILPSNKPEKTFAFKRIKDNNEVLVVTNLSDETQAFAVPDVAGDYQNYFTGKKEALDRKFQLKPWGYSVYIKE